MTLVLSGYRDAELVGEGGLGRVYRAVRISTGGLVAVKELRDVASASPAWHRAMRELEAMLRLKGHAGVTSVEEIVEGPHGPCIVMEYVSGGSLMDRLAGGSLPLPEVVLVGREVAEALDAAHRLGVVHRDVKPHNLLVSSFGHIKVCDFGISALAREAGGRTQTHALTLAYASPEELDGSIAVGPPADVYSLSATLQHLATGRKPSFQERMGGAPALSLGAASGDPVAQLVWSTLTAAQATDPAARPTMADVLSTFEHATGLLGPRRLGRLVPLTATPPDGSATVRRQPPPLGVPPAPDLSDGRATVIRSGRTAMLVAPAPPPPPGHFGPPPAVPSSVPQPSRSPASRRTPIVVAAVAAVALVVALVAVVALGRGDDIDVRSTATLPIEQSTSSPATSAASVPAASSTAPNATALPVAASVSTSCPAADGSSPATRSLPTAPPICIDPALAYSALVETNHGAFTIGLDATAAPINVNNFVTLARYHYYDASTCHRVITDFVVQCGRPGDQSTETAPGYTVTDELPAPGTYAEGVVAVANTGQPNTGGGQWFIITGPDGVALPPQYTVLGRVTEGYDTTVKALESLADPKTANGVPTLRPIAIARVTVSEALPSAVTVPIAGSLDEVVAADREYATTELVGSYVVQIAGKALGAYDEQDRVVYDEPTLLAKYHALDAQYGVVIIRQDEFNHSTSRPDLYQMIVRQRFESKAAGTQWCHDNGLVVPDQCYARDRLAPA